MIQTNEKTMRRPLATTALCLGLAASAQNPMDLSELLRSDLRTQHQAIVLANLGLDEAQSAAFMPIYDAYSADLKKHWDNRIVLVRDYAAKYKTMDDETAAALMKRMTALDKEGVTLRDSYAKKVKKVLPATMAARWMQIERRLNQMVELQVADQIPLMPAVK
jgi:hypothetical protein